MDESELRRAAEAVALGNYGAFDLPARESRLWKAAQDVCGRWIDEHRADDGEPVTESWLCDIGFDRNKPGGTLRKRSAGVGPVFTLFFDPELGCDGCVVSQKCGTDEKNQEVMILAPETRGQFRALCRALGITLTDR